MKATQAQTRCPDIRLRSADHKESEAQQQTFLHTLRSWELPIESFDWGAAYVDLNPLRARRREALSLGLELGGRVRTQLGETRQPALGWDSGKFTAQLAARFTQPGHMKLVDKSEEKSFLRPLPLTLLPLAPQTLQLLHWLGIRTLGDFCALPESAVYQQFGQAGKLAWRWAQGRDNRPVQATSTHAYPPLVLEFDPAEERLVPVENAFTVALRPALKGLTDTLQAVRRLRVHLSFADGNEQSLDLTFVEGAERAERLVQAVTKRLGTLIWPDALSQMQIVWLEFSERAVQQMTLFPELLEEETALNPIVSCLHPKARQLRFLNSA